MEIKHIGIVAEQPRYKYAVKQNNKSNIIIFKFSKQQDSITLDPNKYFYVKVRNSGRTFTDKDPNVIVTSTDNDVVISWTMLRKVTQFKDIDVQVQYEDTRNDIVWQSAMVNINLFDNIPADQEIEDLYPSILMKLQKQIDELKVDIQPPVGGHGIHVDLIDGEHVVSIDENVVQEKEEGKGLSSNDYTNEEKQEVAKVKDKVDKVTGKGLSSNDYTNEEKEAVSEIPNKLDKDALKFATNAEIDNLFYPNYFCIENIYNGNNNITFATHGTLSNPPVLEYSFDKKNWTNLTLNQAVTVPVDGKMYVRGDNDALSESISKYTHITSTQDIKVSGNIMSLLDKTCELMSVSDYCFYKLFIDCTTLLSLPLFTATSLEKACYYGMFRGCTKIKLSTTQTGEYQTPYRIPTSGTGVTELSSLNNMFTDTGGTFKGTPEINTIYYTSNEVIE